MNIGKAAIFGLGILAYSIGGCNVTENYSSNSLKEDFHYGIPKHEVMERTKASDITDLLCYKGGYILNKNSDTTSLSSIAPLNMLVLGYGEAKNKYGAAQFNMSPDKEELDKIVNVNLNYQHFEANLKKYRENMEENVLDIADTQQDEGYKDKVITGTEIEKTKNEILKKSLNGEFTE